MSGLSVTTRFDPYKSQEWSVSTAQLIQPRSGLKRQKGKDYLTSIRLYIYIMQIHGITEITSPSLIENGQNYLIHPQVVSSEVTMALSSPKELLK